MESQPKEANDVVTVHDLAVRARELLATSAEEEHLDTGDALEILRLLEQLDASKGGTKSPDLLMVCANCGSANVEWLDWVNANTGESTATYESNSADDTWCPDCQQHAGTTTLADWDEEHGEDDEGEHVLEDDDSSGAGDGDSIT